MRSQCRRGVYASFKSFLTLITESLTAQILIIYAPGGGGELSLVVNVIRLQLCSE